MDVALGVNVLQTLQDGFCASSNVSLREPPAVLSELIGEGTARGVFEKNVVVSLAVFDSAIVAVTFNDVWGRSKNVEDVLLGFERIRG